jgi:hypothetical protein
MKEFFNEEMFKNLVVVIALDLERPHHLRESFEQWNRFINESIGSIISEIDVSKRKKILENFE